MALATLVVLCCESQFTNSTTRPGRKEIADQLGCSEATVKRALAELRAVGVIEAVAYERGGRHMATVYKLTTKAQNRVTHEPESPEQPESTETGSNLSENRVKSDGKPGHPRPTSYIPSYIPSYREKGRGLVAPDAAAHAASAPVAGLTAQQQAVVDIMRAEKCGVGPALDILKARRRAEAEDLP